VIILSGRLNGPVSDQAVRLHPPDRRRAGAFRELEALSGGALPVGTRIVTAPHEMRQRLTSQPPHAGRRLNQKGLDRLVSQSGSTTGVGKGQSKLRVTVSLGFRQKFNQAAFWVNEIVTDGRIHSLDQDPGIDVAWLVPEAMSFDLHDNPSIRSSHLLPGGVPAQAGHTIDAGQDGGRKARFEQNLETGDVEPVGIGLSPRELTDRILRHMGYQQERDACDRDGFVLTVTQNAGPPGLLQSADDLPMRLVDRAENHLRSWIGFQMVNEGWLSVVRQACARTRSKKSVRFLPRSSRQMIYGRIALQRFFQADSDLDLTVMVGAGQQKHADRSIRRT
jgi:hypothetical protein